MQFAVTFKKLQRRHQPVCTVCELVSLSGFSPICLTAVIVFHVSTWGMNENQLKMKVMSIN